MCSSDLDIASCHRAHDLASRRLTRRQTRRDSPVAQHRHSVRDSQDLVEAVLAEAGKFATDIIAPLNAIARGGVKTERRLIEGKFGARRNRLRRKRITSTP